MKKHSLRIRRKKAFTLAEVLITLGIIGVVAVLTIVPLVKNYQEKALVNRLKETYSMLSRAHQMAVVTYGEPNTWDLGGIDGLPSRIKLSNYYKPFLKITKDCGNSNTNKCFYTGGYKALFNNKIKQDQDASYRDCDWAKVQLINGASLAFWSPGTCSETSCGSIIVDINGPKPPNKAGVDYFWFYVDPKRGVLFLKSTADVPCEYRNTSNLNGTRCTWWVINKGNMDYLRRDISNEW